MSLFYVETLLRVNLLNRHVTEKLEFFNHLLASDAPRRPAVSLTP